MRALARTLRSRPRELGLPRIAFISRLDRERTSFSNALNDLEKSLEAKPVLLALPIGEELTFKGVIEHINTIGEYSPRNLQTADERADQVFAARVGLREGRDQLRAGMAAFIRVPKYSSLTPTTGGASQSWLEQYAIGADYVWGEEGSL